MWRIKVVADNLTPRWSPKEFFHRRLSSASRQSANDDDADAWFYAKCKNYADFDAVCPDYGGNYADADFHADNYAQEIKLKSALDLNKPIAE